MTKKQAVFVVCIVSLLLITITGVRIFQPLQGILLYERFKLVSVIIVVLIGVLCLVSMFYKVYMHLYNGDYDSYRDISIHDVVTEIGVKEFDTSLVMFLIASGMCIL